MNSFSSINLDTLNANQRQGVLHDTGPMLILAGAGSGKTRVVTTRISWLIMELGISPRNILALTFTNKAAREMKERVRTLVPANRVKGLWVGTFHSFCVRLLKKHIALLGYREKFSIFNSGDKIHLIQNIMKDLNLDLEKLKPEDVAWKISDAKNSLIHPSQASLFFGDSLLAEIYGYYQQTLKGFNIVDFDDLLMLTVDIFEQFPELAVKYSSQYRYLMVDEYQDTNKAQYSLLRGLTVNHDNIAVVGDDDQSIYAWRGADISNILNFENDFPGTQVIRLEQNYRSTAVILEAANSLITHNSSRKGKKLWTSGERGDPIRIIAADDETDEAESVYQEIVRLRRDFNANYRDIALVFRTNFQTRPFEELLTERSIPYEVIGGTKFFDRKEAKDIIGYLRLLANRHDELALLRIINKPKRGIGPQTIQKVIAYAAANDMALYDVLGVIGSVDNIDPKIVYAIEQFFELIERFGQKIFTSRLMAPVVKELIQEVGYEEELLRESDKDINKFQKSQRYVQGVVNSIAAYEHDPENSKPDLFGYLERIALMTGEDNQDDQDKPKNHLTLLTMHACKGLEFPYVFISGVEEGTIPHMRSIEAGDNNIEEERRLFYVGITRARIQLCLSFAGFRRRYGEEVECIPSRFLDEIDPSLLNWIDSGNNEEVSEDEIFAALDKLGQGEIFL